MGKGKLLSNVPTDRSCLIFAAAKSNRAYGSGGRGEGQHSIRINNQWRICFRWFDSDAFEMEIVTTLKSFDP